MRNSSALSLLDTSNLVSTVVRISFVLRPDYGKISEAELVKEISLLGQVSERMSRAHLVKKKKENDFISCTHKPGDFNSFLQVNHLEELVQSLELTRLASKALNNIVVSANEIIEIGQCFSVEHTKLKSVDYKDLVVQRNKAGTKVPQYTSLEGLQTMANMRLAVLSSLSDVEKRQSAWQPNLPEMPLGRVVLGRDLKRTVSRFESLTVAKSQTREQKIVQLSPRRRDWVKELFTQKTKSKEMSAAMAA